MTEESLQVEKQAPEQAEAPPEVPEATAEVVALQAEVAVLQEEVARLHNEKDEVVALAMGLRADFENFRRRSREEAAELKATAAADLAKAVLPALDNLERALAAAETAGESGSLRQGVAMTRELLYSALCNAGVEPIPAVGEVFDPTRHEALTTVEGSGSPDQTIVEELQRGYLLAGRLLRPSLVKVARG